jgi:hypothetical protein
MFRRKCDGKNHKWSRWETHNRYGFEENIIKHRSCKCGAIQRFRPHTGEATIWSPDGVESGLLDSGIKRKIYEDL